MTQSLSWNLHGNDQLSAVLEKLDRTVSRLARSMDDGSGKAREYGRSIGAAEAPTTRFHSSVKTTNGHLDGMVSKLASAGAALRTMGITAAVAAAAAAGAAAKFGIQMAAANEDARISFELMLGSAEKANAFLADLMKFAAATPFEMPQLRTAASRLLAVGVNAKDIIPILTTLGDATAGMGTGAEGIERAVTALTQMKQKTKVTGEEMMQLTEAGIPAWETLAAKLGVDVATAMKMVERREVEAGVIFDAVQQKQGAGLQRLTGMMQKQSSTLNGMWSTFKDNASQALATFMEPAMPKIKAFLGFLGDNIPKALDKLKEMGGQFSDIFAGSDVPQKLKDSLKDLGEKILPALKKAWDDILKTIKDNKEGLEKLQRFVTDIAIPLLGKVLPVAIAAIGVAFEGVIWGAAHVVDAIQIMATIFLEQLGMIIHGAEAAFGWIPGLGPKLHEAAAEFDAWAAHIMDKLNSLDGKKVTIDVEAKMHSMGVTHPGLQQFAEGGMVQGPYGSPQLIVAHAGERVLTAEQQRSGVGGGGLLGYLRVVHETPDGHVLREELLALKRQRNLSSLGF